MRYKFSYTHLLFPLFLLLGIINANAQYPGGVSSGTTRGYKVDYYNGTFSDQTQFGAGTSNAVPGNSGYSNKITNTEFYPLDNTYYGLEYTGVLEISTAGTYTFTLGNVDDRAWLYIDGSLIAQAVYTTAVGSQTVGVALTAGDHTIKIKSYNTGGGASTSLQVSNGPSGSGITTATDVDGRFVRYDGAKLTGWYKATDLSVTPNYGGAGIDKVNGWTNKAPDYAGNGDMSYFGSSGGSISQRYTTTNLLNFNPIVRFDGDDDFAASSSQKGLSFRGATKSMFMVADYSANAGQTSTWMFYHMTSTNANYMIGFWKGDGALTQMAVQSAGASATSTYTLNEPKLMGGFVDQVTGAAAPSNTNPLSLDINGTSGTVSNVFSNVATSSTYGLIFGNSGSYMNTNNIPEAIYYPIKLSAVQERQINTYLAIKYGVTLTHDYLNTSGTTVFGLAANTGYTSRIFGIGRELAVEGLNQKQSQSQMTSAAGYDFLTVSKGAIAVSNATNTGTLNDGDYLILGDNNGALAAQSSEIPASYASTAGCNVARIGREWKVQMTNAPGAVTFQAGAASFYFPKTASGLTLLVDTDGDGDFTTGTVNTYQAASFTGGVATFNGVSLASGNVITFAWTAVAPGGVSNGLQQWMVASSANLTYSNFATRQVSAWSDQSANAYNMTAQNTVTEIDNSINYNPALFFNGGGYFGNNLTFSQSNTAGDVFGIVQGDPGLTNRGFPWYYGTGAPGNQWRWSDGNIYEGFGSNTRLA